MLDLTSVHAIAAALSETSFCDVITAAGMKDDQLPPTPSGSVVERQIGSILPSNLRRGSVDRAKNNWKIKALALHFLQHYSSGGRLSQHDAIGESTRDKSPWITAIYQSRVWTASWSLWKHNLDANQIGINTRSVAEASPLIFCFGVSHRPPYFLRDEAAGDWQPRPLLRRWWGGIKTAFL